MNRNIIIAVIVLVVILAGGFFLFSRNQAPTSTTPEPTDNVSVDTNTSTDSTSLSSSPSAESSQVKEILVESNGLSFTPNTITVNKGDKVRLTYKNNMGTHDLNLEGYNVKTKLIGAGQSETIEFTADKTGSFEFYCTVPGHRQAGMKGTLTVQ